jgi:hypothetical protein
MQDQGSGRDKLRATIIEQVGKIVNGDEVNTVDKVSRCPALQLWLRPPACPLFYNYVWSMIHCEGQDCGVIYLCLLQLVAIGHCMITGRI